MVVFSRRPGTLVTPGSLLYNTPINSAPTVIDHHPPQSPFPMSGPHPPPLTAPVIQPTITSLSTLQSQFAAFQEDLGGVKSDDVGDVLVQLDALRKAQNTTYMAFSQLEDVIGVPADAKSKTRARRRRGGGATAGNTDPQTTPTKTLFESLASIQSTVDELLHEIRASSSRECSLLCPNPSHLTDLSLTHRATETSPSSMPGQEPCQTSSSAIPIVDPSQHHPESQSTQPAPTNVHSKGIYARFSRPISLYARI